MEMYVSARVDFDNLLFEHTKQFPNIFFQDNCTINDIQIYENSVSITSEKIRFERKNCSRCRWRTFCCCTKIGKIPMDKSYHIAALRVYYENVAGFMNP